MNYQTLKQEIALPAYDGLTDQQIADAMNTANINRNRTTITGEEMLESMDTTEYALLLDTKKLQWLSICSMDRVDPWGRIVDVVKDIWGNGSTTLSNLASVRVETISRAGELGLSDVSESDVAYARAL